MSAKGCAMSFSFNLLTAMDFVGVVMFAFTGTLKAAILTDMDVLGCVLVGW